MRSIHSSSTCHHTTVQFLPVIAPSLSGCRSVHIPALEMGDPVGLTASILTLLGAAAQLGKLINSIHNAPAELLALSNEVNDLSIVYRELENVRARWPEANENLLQTLRRANEKIAALQQLVDDSTSKGSSAMGRISWVMRKKGKIQKTQQELREVRSHLDTLIATNNL
jgi:predicted  nucleic acid-binding Zn-ribbon protein